MAWLGLFRDGDLVRVCFHAPGSIHLQERTGHVIAVDPLAGTYRVRSMCGEVGTWRETEVRVISGAHVPAWWFGHNWRR